MSVSTFHILLVEDDPAHAELIQRCLQDQTLPLHIEHVVDGEQALQYLFPKSGVAQATDFTYPDLILLDLRLPKYSGLEVLEKIRTNKHLSSIPVIILSTSQCDQDIKRAYHLHVNSYLVKPASFAQFEALVSQINQYWFQWNCTPQ